MTAPSPSPEEVDAACVAARVPGRGLSRMDMVAALEAAAEVREAAGRQRALARRLMQDSEARGEWEWRA